jgi:hypothetical protein
VNRRKHLMEGRWPAAIIAAVLPVTVLLLRLEGRLWWCACGNPRLWDGDIWSAHNSQHLFDAYSFTHLLHGVLLCGVVALLWRRLPLPWLIVVAVGFGAFWEVIENSAFIIRRYREATISLGYEGDSIANSMADILCCAVGCALARRLGLYRAMVLFVVIEVILLVWIRDNLTLNILMLIHPFAAIKAWQMVH